jgi:predicted DNA-binding transcriptional regulator AlpA
MNTENFRLLNAKEVCANLGGISKASLYRLLAANKLPKPLKISPRRVGWRMEDIAAFVSNLQT